MILRFPRRALALALLAFAVASWHGQELGAATGEAPVIASPLRAPAPKPRGSVWTADVAVSGTGPFTYTWKLNGTAWKTNVSDSYGDLINVNADYPNEGAFSVTVSNDYGSASRGPVTFDVVPGPPVVTFYPLPEEKQAAPGVTRSILMWVSGYQPITYQWRKDGRNFGPPITDSTGAAKLTVPQVPASNGNYDCVMTNADGTTTSEPFHVGYWDKPTVRLVTPVQVIQDPYVTLDATDISNEPPLAFQWQFNGVSIPGATDQLFSRSATSSFELAGSYRVIMRTLHYTSISNSVTVVAVGKTNPPVVVAQGGKTTLTVQGARPGPSYRWAREDGKPLSTHCTGALTSTLTISNADMDGDAATYRCVVSGSGFTASYAIGGITDVQVVKEKPEFNALDVPLVGAVAMKWGMQLSATNLPSKFGASGLPQGVVIDTKTGLISGAPLKPGTYHVTLTVTNPVGTTTAGPFTVTIAPLAADIHLNGTWVGPIGTADLATPSLCSCSVTVTTVGTFTGKVWGLFGGATVRSFGFSGAVGGNDEGAFDGTSAPFIVPKSIVPFSSGVVTLSLRFANGHLSGALNDMDPDVTMDSAFVGYRNPWSAVSHQALPYVGPYTAELAFIYDRTPQGAGYATFTVRTDGTFTFVGKLPDGTAFAIPAFIDGFGDAWIKTTLYGGKGVLENQITFSQGTDAHFLDNQVGGDLHFIRPGSTLTPVEPITNPWFYPIYETLVVIGNRYLAPGSGLLGLGPLMMNASNSYPNNIRFTLEGGDLTTTTYLQPTLNAKQTVSFPAFVNGGEVKPTSLVFNPATGLFTGAFVHYFYDDATGAMKSSHSTAMQGVVVRNFPGLPGGTATGFHVTTETLTIHDTNTPEKAVKVTLPVSGSVTIGVN